jgi:hypothetical protein
MIEPLVVREGDTDMPSVKWIAYACAAMGLGSMVAHDLTWIRMPTPRPNEP